MALSSHVRPPLWGQPERPELPPRGAPEPERIQALERALRPILGPRLLTDPASLLAYSYDATGERHWPDAVALPDSAEEVGAIVKAAADAGLAVIPRGAATNLSGGVVPLRGGVVVALGRLNRLKAVDVPRLRFTAEPGLVNHEAQQLLAAHGFFFAADPGSHRVSTLGGNVAENAGGPHCVKYGVTQSQVIALRGFLADGTPVELRRPEIPGYLDWIGLVTGSEGTLVVLTELVLAARLLPPATTTVLATFADPATALGAVAALVQTDLEPSSVELLDQPAVRLVENFIHAGYPTEAGAVLLVEVEGSAERCRADAERVASVLEAHGALEVRRAQDATEAERLWAGRRSAYGALAQQSAHVWVQDVTVPRPALADMMRDVVAIGERYGLQVITVAHAGDGNLHPNFGYNPADADEVRRLKAADRDILKACVDRDGSITGEHGIGIDKREQLALMYQPAELDLMTRVKRVFDPGGRLNPYKAILEPKAAPESAATPRTIWAPRSENEVVDAVAAARQGRQVFAVRGAGRRAGPADEPCLRLAGLSGIIRLDADNQTVEVWAGTPVGELDAALQPTGLEWAVDPWAPEETVGGVLAGALPTFRWHGLGPVRDQVLGVTVVDGQARLLRFGRPTIKNVAGYDVTKLVVGSFGTLAVITRAILRLRLRRPLTWYRRSGTVAEQAAWADALRHRYEGPSALLMTPDGLVTAWREDRTPTGAGEPIADPRPAWAARLTQNPRAWAWDHRPDGLADMPANWLLAWPGIDVVLRSAEAEPLGPWVGRIGMGTPLPEPLRTLSAGVKEAFDPYRLFRGDVTL